MVAGGNLRRVGFRPLPALAISMPFLSLFWARLALSLYTFGMATALLTLAVRRETLFRLARSAVAVGFCFHFVSIVETGVVGHHFPATQYGEATSLLAFIIVGFFLIVYRFYSPASLAVVVFPLVFILTLASIYGSAGAARLGASPAAPGLDNRWIYGHAVLIFLGYAALTLAFAGGVLYLIAEHGLKSHPPRAIANRLLPPLQTLDTIGYRALIIGFPLLTLGILIGLYWADNTWGRLGLSDPKVALTLLTWAIYLILLFSRWSAGWRGRKAAYVTILCFLVAAAGWVSGNQSGLHHFWTR